MATISRSTPKRSHFSLFSISSFTSHPNSRWKVMWFSLLAVTPWRARNSRS